jgi:hypothetical protein
VEILITVGIAAAVAALLFLVEGREYSSKEEMKR